MDTITIEVKEVGDKTQFYFHGTVGELPPEPQTVGAGAGESGVAP
jgi:hypothetical protein